MHGSRSIHVLRFLLLEVFLCLLFFVPPASTLTLYPRFPDGKTRVYPTCSKRLRAHDGAMKIVCTHGGQSCTSLPQSGERRALALQLLRRLCTSAPLKRTHAYPHRMLLSRCFSAAAESGESARIPAARAASAVGLIMSPHIVNFAELFD